MNNDIENDLTPDHNDPQFLPPADLEDRVVTVLRRRGLLHASRSEGKRHLGWLTLRAALVAAACVAFLAVGVLIGSSTNVGQSNVLASLVGDETNLYAVLLYETEGYEEGDGGGQLALYEEYNQWVALARQRGQFVAGEDLEVDRGWRVSASADAPRIEPATTVDDSAPLSGIFFLQADNEEQLLALVQELPHVRRGGQVLVQQTIPTNAPPTAN